MELRIAQSALEDLQAIQEYFAKSRMCHLSVMISWLLSWSKAKCSNSTLMLGRVVPEFDLDHIRELIHAPFRVVYLRQAKGVVLIRVWRSERQLELPANAT